MISLSPLITIYDLETPIEFIGEITTLFSLNLKGVSNSRQRLNIHVLKEGEIERQSIDSSIKSVWINFNEKSFLKLTEIKKRKAIVNLITNSFLKISKELNWDNQAIINAQESCEKHNFKFSYSTKDKHKKGQKASINYLINKDKVSIYFTISEKGEKAITTLALDTFYLQIFIFNYFKKFKWLNDNEFGFVFPNGITYSYSTLTSAFNWHFEDNEKNKWFMRSIIYKEFTSNEERVKWMYQ
tara:strand:- start:3084 stop:3809 length:726 start_codon:yes stop_codon:yes gene_type:complete